MDDIFKEIDKSGFCVIEIEDHMENARVHYLINLKYKAIIRKYIDVNDKKACFYDIIKEIYSNNIEEIVKYCKSKNCNISDVDFDYKFNTKYSLIRLNKTY